MAMKKSIYTVNGTIIGEKLAGGNRVDYLTDQLGSVTATVNQSAQVLNTYRYKPYGDTLAKTGNNPDPTFGWNGTQGYKPTKKTFCDFYVRGRHDDSYSGRWTTVDPIGYRGGGWNYYVYVNNAVTVYVDPYGLTPPPPVQHPPYIRPSPRMPGPPRGVKIPGPASPRMRPVRLPSPGQVIEKPAPGYEFPWLRCCARAALVAQMFLCTEQDAGPRPNRDNTCEAKYPGLPRSADVYFEPKFSHENQFRASNCKEAARMAQTALGNYVGETLYPNWPFKNATDGPCPGAHGHHVVIRTRNPYDGTFEPLADIVCCETCDNSPEAMVAIPRCKCAVLAINNDWPGPRRPPWQFG